MKPDRRDILRLPSAPAAPEYQKILEYCTSKDNHPDDKAHLFRHACRDDFWFFCRYATSARFYICELEDCKFHGKHVFDHPYIFNRCRMIQANPDGYLDLEPRAHLKSTIITCYETLWDFLDRPADVVAFVTWELEKIGKSFVDQVQKEMEADVIPGTSERANFVLAYHWPEIFWQDPVKEAKKWKRGELNLKSHPGIKECSISAMSLGAIRTGQHFHTLVWDDIVVERSSSSIDACRDCTKKFRDTAALASSTFNTRKRGAGTRWMSYDTYRTILDEGILLKRPGAGDCYDEKGESVFHPGSNWLDSWKQMLGPLRFAANMRNAPIDEQSSFNFRIEWLTQRGYDEEPEDMAEDGNVYFHVDPAKPKSFGRQTSRTDFIAIIGYAVRPDGKRYVVDMIRDKMGAEETADRIFGIDQHWKSIGNPIKCWWWEMRGSGWDMAYWDMAMRVRKQHFTMKEYADTDDKDVRISKLMFPFERGDIILPSRLMRLSEGQWLDMIAVFRDEEYLRWQPKQGSHWRPTMGARNDDLLDCLAQGESPEVKKQWIIPDESAPKTWKSYQHREDLARQRRMQNNRSTSFATGRSPWAV